MTAAAHCILHFPFLLKSYRHGKNFSWSGGFRLRPVSAGREAGQAFIFATRTGIPLSWRRQAFGRFTSPLHGQILALVGLLPFAPLGAGSTEIKDQPERNSRHRAADESDLKA